MAAALSLACLTTAALVAGLTGALVRWQTKLPIFDIPNARSSHSRPTPRTGGIAIFLSLSCGYLLWRTLSGGSMPPAPKEAWGLFGAAAFFGLGLAEDVLHLSERRRLAVQAGISLAIAAWGPRLSVIDLPGASWTPHPAVAIFLTAFWYTGFVNLFNFMDGTDGLAAGEAMLVGLFMAATARMPEALLVSSAALGFLAYNRAPAKIFMGDCGSYFLGYLLAVLSVIGTGDVPFVVYVMFLGTFITDATTTLIRRILTGEAWLRAHRSHYYQKLTDLGFSHAHVCGMNLGVTGALGMCGLLYVRGGMALRWALLSLCMLAAACVIVVMHRVAGRRDARR